MSLISAGSISLDSTFKLSRFRGQKSRQRDINSYPPPLSSFSNSFTLYLLYSCRLFDVFHITVSCFFYYVRRAQQAIFTRKTNCVQQPRLQMCNISLSCIFMYTFNVNLGPPSDSLINYSPLIVTLIERRKSYRLFFKHVLCTGRTNNGTNCTECFYIQYKAMYEKFSNNIHK
jgi:hypothetical protein